MKKISSVLGKIFRLKQSKEKNLIIPTMHHRWVGAQFLSGQGLEIGALQHPLKVPKHCSVEYLDIESSETLQTAFPELNRNDIDIVQPHYVGDIGKHTVSDITKRTYDFIILNHVLEHVANPIQVIQNILEGIIDSGYFTISIPDKNFSFDKSRPLTTYEHLLADYFLGISEVCNDHYADFLAHVHSEVFRSKWSFLNALQYVRNRREHVHVWDSQTFKSTLTMIFKLLKVETTIIYESMGGENQCEYFAVIYKGNNIPQVNNRKINRDKALKVLLTIYESRPDLQKAFPATADNHLRNLLNWTVISGATIDSSKEMLAPYQEQYEEILSGMTLIPEK